MSVLRQNDSDRSAGVADAEKTLRLISTLPAPEGIEERVKSGLRAAPRQTGVLAWPSAGADRGRWTLSAMRASAAAAIVLVVAGGAWEVYAHIRIAPEPSAVAAPQSMDGGGMSTATAKRTPKTLDGPVAVLPANMKPGAEDGNGAVHPKAHDAGPEPEKNKSSLPNRR
jgi:hypothetical protein